MTCCLVPASTPPVQSPTPRRVHDSIGHPNHHPVNHCAEPSDRTADFEAERNEARAALAAARAERDAALEEVAFLRVQLRSTRAYLAHVVETELADERAERAALLAELTVLDNELQAKVREETRVARAAAFPLPLVPQLWSSRSVAASVSAKFHHSVAWAGFEHVSPPAN
jgi:hypothetical protein